MEPFCVGGLCQALRGDLGELIHHKISIIPTPEKADRAKQNAATSASAQYKKEFLRITQHST
jgi:hypothetical protein